MKETEPQPMAVGAAVGAVEMSSGGVALSEGEHAMMYQQPMSPMGGGVVMNPVHPTHVATNLAHASLDPSPQFERKCDEFHQGAQVMNAGGCGLCAICCCSCCCNCCIVPCMCNLGWGMNQVSFF